MTPTPLLIYSVASYYHEIVQEKHIVPPSHL